jgi:hypothetical protein
MYNVKFLGKRLNIGDRPSKALMVSLLVVLLLFLAFIAYSIVHTVGFLGLLGYLVVFGSIDTNTNGVTKQYAIIPWQWLRTFLSMTFACYCVYMTFFV